MNSTQVNTTGMTIVALIAGYLGGKNVFGFDSVTWTAIITAIVGAGIAIWTAISTRPLALKNTVGNLKATTVVTDQESADALPNNKDVVAATPEIVAAVKKAS